MWSLLDSVLEVRNQIPEDWEMFLVPRSSFLVPRSSSLIPCSWFLAPHSLFLVPRGIFRGMFLVPQRTLLAKWNSQRILFQNGLSGRDKATLWPFVWRNRHSTSPLREAESPPGRSGCKCEKGKLPEYNGPGPEYNGSLKPESHPGGKVSPYPPEQRNLHGSRSIELPSGPV